MSSCSILTTAPPSGAAIVLAQVSLPGASCCRRSLVLLCRRRCAHEAAPYPPGHGHGTSWPPLARVCSRAYADRVLRRRVLPVALDSPGGLSAWFTRAACPHLPPRPVAPFLA